MEKLQFIPIEDLKHQNGDSWAIAPVMSAEGDAIRTIFRARYSEKDLSNGLSYQLIIGQFANGTNNPPWGIHNFQMNLPQGTLFLDRKAAHWVVTGTELFAKAINSLGEAKEDGRVETKQFQQIDEILERAILLHG